MAGRRSSGTLSSLSSAPSAAVSWQPPARGRLKLNADGAVSVAKKSVGMGVIMRDDRARGTLVFAHLERGEAILVPRCAVD